MSECRVPKRVLERKLAAVADVGSKLVVVTSKSSESPALVKVSFLVLPS